MKNNRLKNQKSPSISSDKKKYQQYSYGLKRKVVHEVQSGKRSIEDARIFYQIKGKSLIYSWIKLYGKLIYDPKKAYLMKKSPQERIKELEEKLEIAELQKDILLDITEAMEEEGMDVKKYLPEQLRKDYENHKRKAQ
jgi:transposase-like protein